MSGTNLSDNPSLSAFFDNSREHSPGSLGIIERVVVAECVADVGGHGAELVVWQFRPCASGGAAGAEGGKTRAWNSEVAEGAVEFSDVELGVVGDDEIGTGQKWEQFLGNRRELRRILNILMRDAVDLDEILPEPAMPAGWANQPVAGIDQFPVHKDRNPCRANTRVRVVRCLKIQAGDFHSLTKVSTYQGGQADPGPVSIAVKSHVGTLSELAKPRQDNDWGQSHSDAFLAERQIFQNERSLRASRHMPRLRAVQLRRRDSGGICRVHCSVQNPHDLETGFVHSEKNHITFEHGSERGIRGPTMQGVSILRAAEISQVPAARSTALQTAFRIP